MQVEICWGHRELHGVCLPCLTSAELRLKVTMSECMENGIQEGRCHFLLCFQITPPITVLVGASAFIDASFDLFFRVAHAWHIRIGFVGK